MFRTSRGEKVDLIEYVKNYMISHPGVNIFVGTDSQNYRTGTVYATAVVLYTPGKGGHIIFQRDKTERERVRSVRLMNEVWKSIETANTMCEAGLPKPEFIDIDVSPIARCKSNEVFESAKGLVEGMGYKCRYKTLGPIATWAADFIVRE